MSKHPTQSRAHNRIGTPQPLRGTHPLKRKHTQMEKVNYILKYDQNEVVGHVRM